MLLRMAYRTLLADRGKLLAGLIGVVFSVVLVNVQGGLFLGLIRKASILVERGNADIWVGHKGMHNVDFPHDIPVRWLQRICGIPQVASVEPLSIGFSEMALPSGGFEGVMVVGVEPGSPLGRAWGRLDGSADALNQPYSVIVDRYDNDKLLDPKIGELREIGGIRSRITAKSTGILSFLVTPYVFTSRARATRYTDKSPAVCSYFLVRLDDKANAKAVCQEIERRLPYATALTSSEYSSISINYWMQRTGIGISFGAATALGLLVGLVMVAQTLYAMVLDRVQEYATLKAIGASEREILTVLLGQASGIAIAGVAIGLVITGLIIGFYDSPRAPISIPTGLAILSAGAVILICLIASILPYLRIRRVDAHAVLQG